MKKVSLFLSIASLLLLTGCAGQVPGGPIVTSIDSSTSEESSSSEHSGSGTTTSSSSGSSSSSSSSSSESSSSEEPPVEGLASIALDKNEDIIKTSKRNNGYIVYFLDADNNDISDTLDDDHKEVTWSSSNTSICTVDQYGRVAGVAQGDAIVTCRTNIGGLEARVHIYVSSSGAVQTEYQKVAKDNIDSLSAGDILVFGCPTQGKTASTTVSSGDLVAATSTFSSDGNKITSLGSGTAEFMLGGSYNHWTLEIDTELESGKFANKYLVAFNTNRVGFVTKTGNTEWEIGVDVEDNQLYIQSAANVAGWMMLNMDTNAFSLYTSNYDAPRMQLPDIYRLTIVTY